MHNKITKHSLGSLKGCLIATRNATTSHRRAGTHHPGTLGATGSADWAIAPGQLPGLAPDCA
ncbi:hypothetical protein GCM10010442_38700 [Kitasatospora kifunensis]|uniref:Uncharacterized protein n=1 Tax=Kitasatospora kifunensis TaxID=58351 RepID=A0A7W7R8F5_KITKI|nr:hypothetical protein [Kitasatospora kifunensis]